MRLAKEAHAEVLEYIIGLSGLNQDLWRKATDKYNATRIGPVSRLLIKQRNALRSGLIASAYSPTEMPPAAMAAETEIVSAWDELHEQMRAMWREWEFANRTENGPEANGMAPNFDEQEKTDE